MQLCNCKLPSALQLYGWARGGLWGGGYVQIAYILQRDCPSFPIRIPDGEESTRPQVQFDVSMLSATRLDLNDVTVPFTFTDIIVRLGF